MHQPQEITKSASMVSVIDKCVGYFFFEDPDLTLELLFEAHRLEEKKQSLARKHDLSCKSMDLIGILRHRALINELYRSCELEVIC